MHMIRFLVVVFSVVVFAAVIAVVEFPLTELKNSFINAIFLSRYYGFVNRYEH